MQHKKTQAASWLKWEDFKGLLDKLIKAEEYRFAAIIAAGTYCALRINDLRGFTWKDFQGGEVTIEEEKRKKVRTITVNPQLKTILDKCRKKLEAKPEDYITASQTGVPMSIQYINKHLKYLLIKNGIQVAGKKLNGDGISTHMFRKTLCREIWKRHDYSEQSLILISKMLNHSDLAITRMYLGITDSEIKKLYLCVD